MATKLRLNPGDIVATLSTFHEADKRCNELAQAAIQRGATDIAALARKMSPVDKMNLEKAIRASRDTSTRSFRYLIQVRDSVGGVNVAAYAWRVHELMSVTNGAPTNGILNPSKKSQAKARMLGVGVGGGYLKRALAELRDDVAKNVKLALAGAINSLPRRQRRSSS